jgi:hypothetical protein
MWNYVNLAPCADATCATGRWVPGEIELRSRERFVATGEIVMSDLVVIEFPSEAKAEEIRQRLLDMQKDYLIDLGSSCPRPPSKGE